MSDFIYKIKIIIAMLSHDIDQWKREVWNSDLDSYYCCSGQECSCGGISVRNLWNFKSVQSLGPIGRKEIKR